MQTIEQLVLALAATQYGLVTRRQALELGMTKHQIDHRVRSRRWVRVDDGVYMIAGQPLTWEAKLLAHCLAHPAVVSHRSATEFWKLPGGTRELVEITSLRHLRRSIPGVIWHESYLLDERRDVTVVDGIPVTMPTRVIPDMAGVCDMDVVEAALDNAEARGLTTKSHLLYMLARRNMMRRPGAGALRDFLDRRLVEAGRPMSHYETRLRQVLRAAGLDEPVAQYELRDSRGLIGRADFAVVRSKLAIEMQSYAWHAGGASLLRDSRRFARCASIGWRVLPVVTTDLDTNPDGVVELVRDAVRF